MVVKTLDAAVEAKANLNGHTNGHHNGVDVVAQRPSAVLSRDLKHEFPAIVKGDNHYLVLSDGRRIFDAAGGAAVACLGHSNKRVAQAAAKQLLEAPYCATVYYTTRVYEELCRELVDSTGGEMTRAYIVNSGSEAMEAAMKLARQLYLEKGTPEPQRTRFISRRQSYHGITLGALAAGGHEFRRAKFEPLLATNVSRVSPCFAYRGQKSGESDEQYVARLVQELDDEFQRVGPETVCAFIAEPVVGAALGCATALPGYFKAVQAVCRKYGALLILDEVMCGMGRTGTLHAWQQEDVVPDIQTIGKGLGGGYQPVAGVLISRHVVDILESGSSVFIHGHTYQGHPVGCAAALEVQRIIREDGLIANVRQMGQLLSTLLYEQLGSHPNVGNIRGRGLFWGLELVADKETAEPFPFEEHTASAIGDLALTDNYLIALYPGMGCAEDGISGDHVIIAPPYTVRDDEIRMIVSTLARLIGDYFALRAKTLTK